MSWDSKQAGVLGSAAFKLPGQQPSRLGSCPCAGHARRVHATRLCVPGLSPPCALPVQGPLMPEAPVGPVPMLPGQPPGQHCHVDPFPWGTSGLETLHRAWSVAASQLSRTPRNGTDLPAMGISVPGPQAAPSFDHLGPEAECRPPASMSPGERPPSRGHSDGRDTCFPQAALLEDSGAQCGEGQGWARADVLVLRVLQASWCRRSKDVLLQARPVALRTFCFVQGKSGSVWPVLGGDHRDQQPRSHGVCLALKGVALTARLVKGYSVPHSGRKRLAGISWARGHLAR